MLLDEEDRLVAVIDFDQLRYTSCGHELMRALSISFPGWSNEGFAFFQAYARASRISAPEVREICNLSRYAAASRTWPMSVRNLEPEKYQPIWDQFIVQPDPSWDDDPSELEDRLVALAVD